MIKSNACIGNPNNELDGKYVVHGTAVASIIGGSKLVFQKNANLHMLAVDNDPTSIYNALSDEAKKGNINP